MPPTPHLIAACLPTTTSIPKGAVHLVLNPTSGGGAGLRVRPELERVLAGVGREVLVHVTGGPGHAVELAAAAHAAGAGMVVAVGGDGTAHEVANGLLDARQAGGAAGPALALVPVGTGNDFAKVLPGAAPRARALRTVGHGTVRAFDAGRVHWNGRSEWFVNAMGTGIDGEVVRQLARSRNLPGGAVYLTALVRALLGYRPIPVRLTAGDFRFEGRVMTLAAGNGRCVGGAFQLCPGARPDDGLLDVSIIAEIGPWGIARTLPGVLTGRLAGKPGYLAHRTRRLRLELLGPGPHHVQLDGELREVAAPATLEVEVVPGVLPVLTDVSTEGDDSH